MKASEKLATAMREKKISIRELSERTGVPKSAIQRYTSGETEKIPIDRMQRMAEALGISPAYVMGWDQSEHTVPFGKSIDGLIPRDQLRTRRVPILGDTAAGEPVIANRVYDEWVDVPDDGHHRYDAALRVAGDSMMPLYHKDDLVFIRYQDDVRDGQIAAVGLGDTVTLKRVYHIPNGVQLISENRDFPAQTYTADDVGNIHICGLAVGVLHFD